ncbi:thiamine phosphate synthase [Rhodoligotrophos defluvii]|uniref:thiamine phosphate synthase n=1 Tax=Rhodoligotrophos defluvii TaxID=2561934 RepID=UPI0010C9FF13|nr:thiamine phosphate synthase [Rhodoligotrophos defluvii]
MLDRFYLIVDDVHWLERLLPWGVKLVQLRVKDRSEDEVRQQVRRARLLCKAAGAQLIVNDYWQIAIDEDCDFIHLGQGDLDDADLPAIARAGIRLGVSTHDDAELDRALAVKPDYVALGPVFPTILKKMPWAPQGLDKVAEWKRRIAPLPLVAIGGLTPERARAVLEAGADSAAVVTDILLNPNPEERTREWIAATR